MRIASVLKPPGIRTILASLVIFGATEAVAATVVVDREQLQQQLQTLAQQVALAQQQIDQAPTARVQLTTAVQQLQAAQRQLGELARQLSLAPPAPTSAPQYAPPGAPQYPPAAPQYSPAGPATTPAPQYPPAAPAAPQYPSPTYQNAMSDADFRSLLQQITGASSNEKLNVLRQSSVGNSFLVDQVARILPLYIYTADRLVALQILAPQLIDRPGGFKLLSLFHDSEDREQAQRILFVNGALAPPPR